MSKTIYYACKYAPLELFAGYGATFSALDPLAESFSCAERCAHANLCGYAKAVLEQVEQSGIRALVLTNCCDAMLRVYDVLAASGKMEFLQLLPVPHQSTPATRARFARDLRRLADALQRYTGQEFDAQRAHAFFVHKPHAEGPHLTLLGAHGGSVLYDTVQKAFALPVVDATCTGNRELADVAPAALEDFLPGYAAALLGQMPCMRMDAPVSERAHAFFVHKPHADGPHLTLLGAHGGSVLYDTVQKAFALPVVDATCTGNRELADVAPAALEDFLPGYAAALLGQMPCMRMDAPVSERAALVDGQTVGIVYHTVQFCDYYAPGLTAPEQFHLPVLKIETDCSRQTFTSGGGQLSTRLGAFAESLNAVPDTENKEAPAMNTNAQYAAGIDSGSASTDAVILDRSGKICGWAIVPTGAGAATGARQALEQALTMAGIAESDLGSKVYTGYGREFLGDDGAAVTEITCHARGAHHLDPAVRTVIDIGGQDSKVIRLSESGAVETFAMNDKCAAGTGRFLEMMARTLQMKLPEMSELGLDWHNDVTISSMCTVFAESEVVSLIARSTAPADIIHGLNKSVAGKTAALARRTGGVAPFMMTGGVARNRGVVKELETALKAPVEVSEYSQLCGSLGAALFALEKMGVKL